MTRTVRVHLVDDIDGSTADDTVGFVLDGIEYRIDLSKGNAEKLRTALATFVGVARRSDSRRAPSRTGRAPRSRAVMSKNSDIRDWAKRSGIEVNDYGRIPRSVVDKYEASVGR